MRSKRGRRGNRQARHGPQAPRQGRWRRHARGGGGLHGQGRRADGPPRHRRGAAGRRRAAPRRGGHVPHTGGGSLQRGEGPAVGVDGERAALSGGPARSRRRAGRGGHRARVRFRPGAGRAVVHVVAAAGELPAGAAAARVGGRVGRRVPAVVAARVRGAGAPAAGRGRSPGGGVGGRSAARRRRPRGRRWRWCSPIAARGSIGRTPRSSRRSAGPGGLSCPGRVTRRAPTPGRGRTWAAGRWRLRAAGPSMASRAPAPARRAAPRAAGWSPAGHARHPARRVHLAPRALLPCRGRRSKRLRRGRAAQSPAVAGSVGSGA